jgi:hypothetical protein
MMAAMVFSGLVMNAPFNFGTFIGLLSCFLPGRNSYIGHLIVAIKQ